MNRTVALWTDLNDSMTIGVTPSLCNDFCCHGGGGRAGLCSCSSMTAMIYGPLVESAHSRRPWMIKPSDECYDTNRRYHFKPYWLSSDWILTLWANKNCSTDVRPVSVDCSGLGRRVGWLVGRVFNETSVASCPNITQTCVRKSKDAYHHRYE